MPRRPFSSQKAVRGLESLNGSFTGAKTSHRRPWLERKTYHLVECSSNGHHRARFTTFWNIVAYLEGIMYCPILPIDLQTRRRVTVLVYRP